MQRGLPSKQIGLLDVDLRTSLAAALALCVAVVIGASGVPLALPHGGEIERGAAAALGTCEISGVAQALAKQIECHILAAVVSVLHAIRCEVHTATNRGANFTAVNYRYAESLAIARRTRRHKCDG
jgi:hypothetical protein